MGNVLITVTAKNELSIQILLHPTEENMKEEKKAYDPWFFLSSLEEKILSQKAKVHWLGVGNGNNKQFYRAAKVQEVRNSIREIQRQDGSITKSQEEIKDEAVNHLTQFLSTIPADYVGTMERNLDNYWDFSVTNMT